MGGKKEPAVRPEPLSAKQLHQLARGALADLHAARPSDLKKKLPNPLKAVQFEECLQALREDAREGRITHWQKGRTEWFFATEPRSVLDKAVVPLLSPGALPAATAIGRLVAETGIPKSYVDDWKKAALASGRLFELAALPATKGKRLGLEPDLRAALARPLAAAKRAVETLRQRGVDDASVAAVVLAELGLGPAARVATPPADDAALVLAALTKFASERRAGALLPVADLRSRVRLSKERFDRATLLLRDRGSVILHHHDHPGSLTERERAQLVLDVRGNHYVGIALDPT